VPLTLTIETGAGVANANCYGVTDQSATLAAARAYAALRGVTLSATDDLVVPLMVKAMDFLESRTDEYVGKRVSPDQVLSWPRKCVTKSDGSAFPTDELPVSLLSCLYQLIVEQANGIDLQPSVEGTVGFVTREKVDVLETQFSQKVVPSSQPLMPVVEALLATITHPVPALRSIRV
jgi:hypothetical protein